MTEDTVEAKSYIHRGIGFGQAASKICDVKCKIHSTKAGKSPGQQPSALNLRLRDVEATRGDVDEPERAGTCDQPAQPCAGAAACIEKADRTCAGSPQVGQFCLQKSPDAPIRVRVQSVKRKQLRRIAIGISDVIVASLVVDIRDALSRSLSWLRKSAQDDKWSFCLRAGTLCPAN